MNVKNKSTSAFVLSIISGISILLNSTLLAMNSASLSVDISQSLPTAVLFGITFIFGVLVLVGSFLMRNKRNVKSGAFMVLIFSFLSLIIGGALFAGFFVGFILGFIGAMLGLGWKPKKTKLSKTS